MEYFHASANWHWGKAEASWLRLPWQQGHNGKPLPRGKSTKARRAAARYGRDAQSGPPIGRQGFTIIPECATTGCVTERRCIVPAHYHVELYSGDQSQEPVAHPYATATRTTRIESSRWRSSQRRARRARREAPAVPPAAPHKGRAVARGSREARQSEARGRRRSWSG